LVAIALTGCGPKAPDQPLRLQGVSGEPPASGFILPETGQVSLWLDTNECQGVLSDFKDDPRTGVVICNDGQRPETLNLRLAMKDATTGDLLVTSADGRTRLRLQAFAELRRSR